jgi:hypothetical protein
LPKICIPTSQNPAIEIKSTHQIMKTKRLKQISVYIEDAPVHKDVMAHGMHRAGSPMLRSIVDYIDSIAIYQIRHRHERSEFDRELEHLCIEMPRLPTLLCKALRRFSAFDFGISDTLPSLALARSMSRASADILFTYVGADPGIMTRAAKLAARTGKLNVFYIVDDFLAPLQIAGASQDVVQRESKRACKALRGAKHIFTITDGLGTRLQQRYGISTTTLRLAFEPDPQLTIPPKKQILYMGSINFLYTACLHDLFRIVDQVRQSSGVDLTVRLMTDFSTEMVVDQLGDLPPFVTSARAKNAEDLAAEIASSLFSFLPYSFDTQEKSMVSTSFPSKALEYLAYARSIVVYGPEYGVATKLFRETNMPSVVTSPDELEKSITSHLGAWPDHSVIYRTYLTQAHSLAAARRTICRDLSLESD